jgi:hypothetical protein
MISASDAPRQACEGRPVHPLSDMLSGPSVLYGDGRARGGHCRAHWLVGIQEPLIPRPEGVARTSQETSERKAKSQESVPCM